jgi:hypothetical protein
MPVSQLTASMIGNTAAELLHGNPVVTVAGTSSRGAFIRFDDRWIVFLSLEAMHGPLTLNLSGDPAPLLKLAPGEPAIVTGEGLVFPALDLDVLTSGAIVWQAPLPPRGQLPTERIRANLRDTVEEIIAGLEDPALPPGLLMELRRFITRSLAGGESAGPFLGILKRLSRALWDNQPAAVAAALGDCLGRGLGLTPSGDDLAMGFLLALRRWGRDLNIRVDTGALQAGVLENAYHQTTTMAANLIECAGNGQTDERLIAALDGIVTGTPDVKLRATYLRSWGSSSGIDALSGMAAVLLAARDAGTGQM